MEPIGVLTVDGLPLRRSVRRRMGSGLPWRRTRMVLVSDIPAGGRDHPGDVHQPEQCPRLLDDSNAEGFTSRYPSVPAPVTTV